MYKNLIELFKENEGKGAVGAFNLHCFERSNHYPDFSWNS